MNFSAKKILLWLLGIAGLCAVLGGIAVAALVYWASRDLPELDRIADFAPPQATTVLARDGSILGSLYHEKRYTVPLKGMSRYIPMAFLAAEDDSFYQHDGINPVAILRAAIINFQRGRTAQGGSTITQQVVKQLLLSPERRYERKIKEAILAYKLERFLSKDDILTVYLNQIYLGQHAYGVEAAARTYFGKHASDITLAESAILAGMPQAPSRYNPFRNPTAAKARQKYVLSRMLTMKWISDEEYEQALKEPLVYWTMPEDMGRASSWYLEEVRRLVIEFFTEKNLKALGIDTRKSGEDFVYESGLTIQTSMEPQHQAAAEHALRRGLEDLDKRQGWRGPTASMDADGIDKFREDSANFSPYDLMGDQWVEALVTKVDKNSATVELGGGWTGTLDVKSMGWARTPNPKVAGARSGFISDARKVLAVNDRIWVSARPMLVDEKDGKKTKKVEVPFDASAVKEGQPLALNLEQVPEVQGALVSIEPQSGDVVALVGGYQFGQSHFNRATQARRQPGSTFKPIVYSAALDNGFTSTSTLLDAPYEYVNPYTKQVWRPSNYSSRSYAGPLPLYKALTKSLNTCTVRVAERIGIATVIQRAKILGLEPYFPEELSVSLGAVAVTPLNLTQAYAAFANKGMGVRPRIVTSIKDASGREIYKQDMEHWQAVTPQNAYIMCNLLKQVVNAGTGTRARVKDHVIAGKTGTSNEERDAWFMGFSPSLVSGVYVGYDQMRPLGSKETGGSVSAPIFAYYRNQVEQLYPNEDFEKPDGIVMADGQAFRSDQPMEGSSAMGGSVDGGQGEEAVDTSTGGEDLLKQLY